MRSYPTLVPRVPMTTSGDAYARCSIERDEISESFRLIGEALIELRTAIASQRAYSVHAGMSVAIVEGPRGAETVAIHVDDRGALQRAHFTSASYRNWPIVAATMDGNIVPDLPLVNHSFSICYACADR